MAPTTWNHCAHAAKFACWLGWPCTGGCAAYNAGFTYAVAAAGGGGGGGVYAAAGCDEPEYGAGQPVLLLLA